MSSLSLVPSSSRGFNAIRVIPKPNLLREIRIPRESCVPAALPDSFEATSTNVRARTREERPATLVLSLIRARAASLNFLLDSDSRVRHALGTREADIF